MKNKPRERCTSATRHRIDNMKAIIEHIRSVGRIPRDDISLFFGYSPSGGRKYIKELAADDIIQIVDFEPKMSNCQQGAPIYGLNKDAAVVDAFLTMLDTMPNNAAAARALVDHSGDGPRMQKVQAEDGRQVHMLRDDVEHKPRSHRFKIPDADPLLAALFGLAGEVA